MIENPERISRLASRVGFGTPTVRDAGGLDQTIEFHLPDTPPRTFQRRMASALVLTPVTDEMRPEPPLDYEMGTTTIRFPHAPEGYYTQDEVRRAAKVAVESVEDYPPGRFRFNPVVEEYAIHYDIAEDDMRDRDPDEFLRETWEVAERFNQGMEEVF